MLYPGPRSRSASSGRPPPIANPDATNPLQKDILRHAGRRAAGLEFFHSLVHALKYRPLLPEPENQSFEHHDAVTAPDDERVTGVGERAPIDDPAQVQKIVDPVVEHVARRH